MWLGYVNAFRGIVNEPVEVLGWSPKAFGRIFRVEQSKEGLEVFLVCAGYKEIVYGDSNEGVSRGVSFVIEAWIRLGGHVPVRLEELI